MVEYTVNCLNAIWKHSVEVPKIVMRQIALLVLVGAVCCVDLARSDELVREKRGWLPSLFGAKPQAEIKQDTLDVTAESANLANYPIWRVHKYNGIHLIPLPYQVAHPASALQTKSEQITPVVIADHRQRNGEIDSINGPVVSSPQITESITPMPQINQPTAPTTASNGNPANLLHLANEFGITNASQLPSLREVAGLLGTTTPEETLDAIQEIANTAEGRSLIRSYIEEQDRSGNYEGAASENVETVIQPETRQNVTDDLDVSESLLIQQYLSSFGGVTNQDTDQVPVAQAQDPMMETEVVAAPVEYDEVEADTPTPAAGPISRFFQWTRRLNPFGRRQQSSTPATVAEPSQTNTAKITSETTSSVGEQSVSYHSVPIPSLPDTAALPTIFGFEQVVPDLPAIHIPYHNIPAYAVRNVEQTNEPGHYVRVQLPVAGYESHLPIDPAYLAQLKTIQLSPESQTYQVNYADQLNAAVRSSETQTPIENTISFNQRPIVVSDSGDIQPTQSTVVNTKNIQLDSSMQPVAQLLLTTK